MITLALNNQTDLSVVFKALGDPTRYRIFEFLRACGCPVAVEDSGDVRPVVGQTVGEICCQITGKEEITSAISFHLKELRLAGLINVERRGKNMLYSINQETLTRLSEYFSQAAAQLDGECCA